MIWNIHYTAATEEELVTGFTEAIADGLRRAPYEEFDEATRIQIAQVKTSIKFFAKSHTDHEGNYQVFAGGNTEPHGLNAATISLSVSKGPQIIHNPKEEENAES